MLRLGPIQGFPSACPANLVAQHKSSLVFRFDGRLAQNGDWEVSLAEVGFFCCRLAQCELRGVVSSEGLLLPMRRADFLLQRTVRDKRETSGHFAVWNAALRDRCRTSDAFSPMRQALHFCTLLLNCWQA